MKRQIISLGKSDPKGCIEAEKRRTANCAHPPIAELYRIWCTDCNTESTNDGKVIISNNTPLKISLNELDSSNIDLRRISKLNIKHKKNLNN